MTSGDHSMDAGGFGWDKPCAGKEDLRFPFLNEYDEITLSGGAYLPHWRQEGVMYFVTFRLADSLPQEKLKAFALERADWLEQHPEPRSLEEKVYYYERFPKRVQKWLDAGFGSGILADPRANRVVAEAIRYFDGERYVLDETVVASNHVHALVIPRPGHSLSGILHSWKGFTAKAILKLPIAGRLSTAPTVWQKESWDHIVRSQTSLCRIREYIRAHKQAGGGNRHRSG